MAHGSAGNLLLLVDGTSSSGRVKRALDRISGLVLVGLGARLALENR